MSDGEWLKDPSGKYDYRLVQDGKWTQIVSRDGSRQLDSATDLASLVPPGIDLPELPEPRSTEVPQTQTEKVAPAPRQAAPPRGDQARIKPVGEQVLNFLGVVTLGSFLTNHQLNVMRVPELQTEVAENPKSPYAVLHLGLRLLHHRVLRDRLQEKRPVGGLESLVLNPLMKAGSMMLTNALRSDNTPPYEKVLRPLNDALATTVNDDPQNTSAQNLIGRINLEFGNHRPAFDRFYAAFQIDQSNGEIAFNAADALMRSGETDAAWEWAKRSHQLDCSLSLAILRDDLRQVWYEFHSPKFSRFSPYTFDRFLDSFQSFYHPVTSSDLDRYLGVNWVETKY